jgi:hypothetical protein
VLLVCVWEIDKWHQLHVFLETHTNAMRLLSCCCLAAIAPTITGFVTLPAARLTTQQLRAYDVKVWELLYTPVGV